MKNEKEVTLTKCMEGFQKEEINYTNYEVSFRRWLVSQVFKESRNIDYHISLPGLSRLISRHKKYIKQYWSEIPSMAVENMLC